MGVTTEDPGATTFAIGGKTGVRRLGFGVLRITGQCIWGPRRRALAVTSALRWPTGPSDLARVAPRRFLVEDAPAFHEAAAGPGRQTLERAAKGRTRLHDPFPDRLAVALL
jgi:hypothetical protein